MDEFGNIKELQCITKGTSQGTYMKSFKKKNWILYKKKIVTESYYSRDSFVGLNLRGRKGDEQKNKERQFEDWTFQ